MREYMRRRLQRLMSDWLPHAVVQFGFALLLTAVTGVVLKVLAKAGTPLVVLACIGVFFIALGLTMRSATAPHRNGRARPANPTGPATSLGPVTPERPARHTPQLIFEDAPPELADMSSASLKEVFAGRTEAQGKALMKQHVGKAVRVSGEVQGVKLTGTPRVDLRSAVALLLFFDADDYDPAPVLLSLHIGDKIVVSGQIYEFTEAVVFLDQCRLIETRGRVS